MSGPSRRAPPRPTLRARLDGLEARLARGRVARHRPGRATGRRPSSRRGPVDRSGAAGRRRGGARRGRPAPTSSPATPSRRSPSERGSLVVAERAVRRDRARRRPRASVPRGAGRGRWRDPGRAPSGATSPARPGGSLARAAWLPDLASCLAIQPTLPAGWIVVTRDGSAIVGRARGHASGPPSRSSSAGPRRPGWPASSRPHEAEARDGTGRRRPAGSRGQGGRRCRRDRARRREPRRRRAAGRRGSRAPGRPAARDGRSASRLARGADRAAAQPDLERAADRGSRAAGAARPIEDARRRQRRSTGAALAAWETRAAELRARRDRLAEDSPSLDAPDATPRTAGRGPRRPRSSPRSGWPAPTGRSLALGERERAAGRRARRPRAPRSPRPPRPRPRARQALGEVQAADAADRERLTAAERDAAAARERLRAADDRLRTADHAELEARLGLEALHEGIVVELAGLGELGIAGLEAAAGVRPGSARIAGALDTRPVEARADGRVASEDERRSRTMPPRSRPRWPS